MEHADDCQTLQNASARQPELRPDPLALVRFKKGPKRHKVERSCAQASLSRAVVNRLSSEAQFKDPCRLGSPGQNKSADAPHPQAPTCSGASPSAGPPTGFPGTVFLTMPHDHAMTPATAQDEMLARVHVSELSKPPGAECDPRQTTSIVCGAVTDRPARAKRSGRRGRSRLVDAAFE